MNDTLKAIANAVNAGALKTGASQYIEAIEAAKQRLADNQMMFILSDDNGVQVDTEAVEVVKLYTFKNNVKELTRVDDNSIKIAYLASTIEVLGGEVFSGRSVMTEIHMPAQLKVVGNSALAGCEKLEKMELPEGVERIEELAFAGCVAMEEIRIPDSVTEIGQDAFADVKHIYYNGTATGAPWGALAMN